MDTSQVQAGQDTGLPQWVQVLTTRRKESAYVLFALALVAAGGAAYLIWKFKWDYAPLWIWSFAIALIALGAGLWQYLREPFAAMSEGEVTRLLVLIAGGLAGLLTVTLPGLGLVVQWWHVVTGGWSVWQGDEGWKIWVILLALVAGLAIMFASLQLARTQTRTSAGLRRLLYGYNALLSSLLLLIVLVVVNCLTYVRWENFKDRGILMPLSYLGFMSRNYDWTSRSLYSLSSKSDSILRSLDRPVTVYVILRETDPAYRWVEGLMANCQAVSNYFEPKYLSPDKNQSAVAQLAEKYQFSEKGRGLLVVYGSGDDPSHHDFLTPTDLIESSFGSADSERQAFKGEAALMTSINFMMENKKKPILYFTQGHGEPSIDDFRDSGPGLGMLRDRLERLGKYEVRGLRLSPDDKEPAANPNLVVAKQVPDDASVVVVAQPSKRLPAHVIDALREYLDKKKGKLIALMGFMPNPDRRTEMLHTGMEELLTKYGVRVGDDVVLHDFRIDEQPPAAVPALTNPDEGVRQRIPIAAAFSKRIFTLALPRTVQGDTSPRPGNPYATDVLLEVPAEVNPWTESDLQRANNQDWALRMVLSGKFKDRVSRRPISVAVVVSENESAMPADEIHAPLRGSGAVKPRLAVFGDADLVSNDYIRGGRGLYYDLFASTVAWLRERPAGIGIEPKKSDTFRWHAETNKEKSRMIWIPAALAVVTVVGLGTGVWIVRRR